MKRSYPVYTIIAILLMVFTFNPVAYASYYNDNGDDYRYDQYDQYYRDYRDDRAKLHDAAGAFLLIATVADLVSNNNHYYNRGPRFHQYRPWSYRNAYYYHHRPVYRYTQHNRWHR